jgi:hypothetical protein
MANQELYKKIEVVYNENHGAYGSPRIYRALKKQDVVRSENRVARLMRLRIFGLYPCPVRTLGYNQVSHG